MEAGKLMEELICPDNYMTLWLYLQPPCLYTLNVYFNSQMYYVKSVVIPRG